MFEAVVLVQRFTVFKGACYRKHGKKRLSYRHGNHSCQSCSLLKCGKNSGSVTRGWKLYREALDRVSPYYSKERQDLAQPKQ